MILYKKDHVGNHDMIYGTCLKWWLIYDYDDDKMINVLIKLFYNIFLRSENHHDTQFTKQK